MKEKKPKWTDFPREDLRMIPTMEKKGWEVLFESRDKERKRTTPDDIPHWDVRFMKDKRIIGKSYYKGPHWYIVTMGEPAAGIQYESLKELLTKEKL